MINLSLPRNVMRVVLFRFIHDFVESVTPFTFHSTALETEGTMSIRSMWGHCPRLHAQKVEGWEGLNVFKPFHKLEFVR